ncbi:MAG: hypothetical protein KF724_10550 [Phycisphaeraceae bacterium]|nr:hypothetical protein [Phycisphaeraceae bacterium]
MAQRGSSNGHRDDPIGRDGDPPDETFIDLGEESAFPGPIEVHDDPSPIPPPGGTPGGARSPGSRPPPPPPAPSAAPTDARSGAGPRPSQRDVSGTVIRQDRSVFSQPGDDRAVRDRIVILGRRASGKTVFLARLYHELFRGSHGLSMQALNGPSHLRCLSAMDDLARGQWPAATAESAVIELEVSYPGGRERLVALDYPGEVFRRAFVEELSGPDVATLLDQVDHAAAVIILIDPGSVLSAPPGDRVEEDFGSIQALRRIRATHHGAHVPVAVVLTKFDVHRSMVEAAGGLRAFIQRYYPPLVREAPGAKAFGCAAVRAIPDPMGRTAPQVRGEPEGLIEPLVWCLERMGRLRREESREALQSEQSRLLADAIRAEEEAERRERRVLTLIWSFVAFVVIVGGFIAWYVLSS